MFDAFIAFIVKQFYPFASCETLLARSQNGRTNDSSDRASRSRRQEPTLRADRNAFWLQLVVWPGEGLDDKTEKTTNRFA